MKYVARSHKHHVGLRNETPVSVKRTFLAIAERSYTWHIIVAGGFNKKIKQGAPFLLLTENVAETLKHTARTQRC